MVQFLTLNPQNFLKSFSELRVEDGVYEGVEAGVDVAEEGGRLEREVAGARVQVVPVDMKMVDRKYEL